MHSAMDSVLIWFSRFFLLRFTCLLFIEVFLVLVLLILASLLLGDKLDDLVLVSLIDLCKLDPKKVLA